MEKDVFRLECGLYDQLELWSMRRMQVKVVFKLVNGEEETIEGLISDIFVRNKQEIIKINNKQEIETSTIIEINSKLGI